MYCIHLSPTRICCNSVACVSTLAVYLEIPTTADPKHFVINTLTCVLTGPAGLGINRKYMNKFKIIYVVHNMMKLISYLICTPTLEKQEITTLLISNPYHHPRPGSYQSLHCFFHLRLLLLNYISNLAKYSNSRKFLL